MEEQRGKRDQKSKRRKETKRRMDVAAASAIKLRHQQTPKDLLLQAAEARARSTEAVSSHMMIPTQNRKWTIVCDLDFYHSSLSFTLRCLRSVLFCGFMWLSFCGGV